MYALLTIVSAETALLQRTITPSLACPISFDFLTQNCLSTQITLDRAQLGVHWLFDLEYQSWGQIIRRATSKSTSTSRRSGLTSQPTTLSRYLRMPFEGTNPHFGTANTPKRFAPCLGRMPGFERLWFSYRTTSIQTSFPQDNVVAVSWQNRSQCRRAHAPCPRSHSHLN